MDLRLVVADSARTRWRGRPDPEDTMPDEPEIAGEEPIAADVEEGELYYWCKCGRSAMQPFCDGSHAGTDIRPLAWVADRTGTVLMCTCKQTKTPPICDDSHESL